MNFKLFLSTYLLFFNSIYSQDNLTINIYDVYKNPLNDVSITIKDSNNNTIKYLTGNEQGFISINFNTKYYTINFNKIGFVENEFLFNYLIKKQENIIILEKKIIDLEEVVIHSDKPIIRKNDTIVFNAASFKQGNEQVVEDLLRKIPGLNIDENGTIKVGNQEIEKVMIDGDDMFEKGYKLLTKNMPVEPIDKVELYQNYSNNKHLKGIENSQKVALNLTLRSDFKRHWFGNMALGYGVLSENRYETNTNIMNFGKKTKYYFLGNANNTGLDTTGDINHLIRSLRTNEPGSIGDDQSANTLLGLGFATPNLKQKRTNLNNAEMLSLNAIFTLSSKTKIKTLGFLNTDENDFFNNSLQNFKLGANNFTNTENFIGRKIQITGFGKVDLTHDISKTKTFEYTGKFNQTNERNRSDLLFNNNGIFKNLPQQMIKSYLC